MITSAKEVLYAEPLEQVTIDFMVRGITCLPQFSSVDMQKWLQQDDSSAVTRAQNFASYVAKEETLLIDNKLLSDNFDESEGGSGTDAEERVLCIINSSFFDVQEIRRGGWAALMSQSPGFRDRSTVQT